MGAQVGVYYLTYFLKEYRFHFNAHNMIVFGKEDDKYMISDPVMETVTSLTEYELQRVRFAERFCTQGADLLSQRKRP